MSILWKSTDCKYWSNQLENYSSYIKKKQHLAELDEWFHDELPDLLKSREPCFLEKSELEKIMRWKLSRGKFRPRLLGFVQSLDDALVVSKSREAFASHSKGELAKAIETLGSLRGIGPATASAVLSVFDASVPFLSDEAMASLPGVDASQYTSANVLKVTKLLREKAEELNKNGDANGRRWSASLVEHALWCESTPLSRVQASESSTQAGQKRKR